ncbi:hypothetical protein VU08_00420 [Desulfobulbus sp. F5]|nr:hypothetical protein [Desulfobulbus sp. F5]
MNEENIRIFVAAWYRALDFHVPLADAYAFLADEGLNMQFPDGDIRDFKSFKAWYDRVTNIFFDENHYVQTVDARLEGETAVVNVVVGWQASWWVAPEAKSKRVSIDATQQWTVRASGKNAYGLEIVTYNATVEPFKYAPGFARL